MSEIAVPKKKRYSYTALSLADQCLYAHYQKYILKNRPEEDTLPLALGNIAHKVKEVCSRTLMRGETPDYDLLMDYLVNGYTGKDKSTGETETLRGTKELKQQFFEQWIEPDTKSGMTYEQKLAIFRDHLSDEEHDTEWHTIAVEQPFEVEFDDVLLFGLIDKIAMNDKGEVKCVDYKTSKKIYEGSDIATPLQMWIYHRAIESMISDGKIPNATQITEHEYDFVFLGQKQKAGTNGWFKRGETKLRKILTAIKQAEETGVWKPKPSPLCFWCQYCKINPNATPAFKAHCPFHSLWLPNAKTYEVAQKWVDGTKAEDVMKKIENKKKNAFWF